MINIIAAVSKNGVIGYKGRIPWDVPQDMEYFRRITDGSSIIMGRKTYESIMRPLPNRLNIIVSRTIVFKGDMLMTAQTLSDAIKLAERCSIEQGISKDIFLCGGNAIYREGLKYADRIYLTEIDREYEGDVYFPPFDKKVFQLVSSKKCGSAELSFNVYEKKISKGETQRIGSCKGFSL